MTNKTIQKITILGQGVMGGDIALTFAPVAHTHLTLPTKV